MKLSERQFEYLASQFVMHGSAKATAERTKISTKTIYRYFSYFRSSFYIGAFYYPLHFSGAGPVLLLGPNNLFPAIEEISDKKHRGYKNDLTKSEYRRYRLLHSYSYFQWKEAETYLFIGNGTYLYFLTTYAPRHNLDARIWTQEIRSKVFKNLPLQKASEENWARCIEQKKSSLFRQEEWSAIFHNRKLIDTKIWRKNILRDLLWFARNHPMGEPMSIHKRNKYWDFHSRQFPDDDLLFEKERLAKLTEKFATGELKFPLIKL